LFPETALFDPQTQHLLVGSVRQGAVFSITRDGKSTPLVTDERLCSVLGIAADWKRRRLFALNTELGVALRRCAPSRNVAAVGVYDLDSGAALNYVSLADLSTAPEHLANAIALDEQGNAYISDSFAGAVYRLDVEGHASLFAKNGQFLGPGIGLNGLVVHPRGYLLVVKKSDGALFRIPLASPKDVTRVALSSALFGADGIALTPAGELIVVANEVPAQRSNRAWILKSTDDWASASAREQLELADDYPTSPLLIGQRLLVLHSQLRDLLSSDPNALTDGRAAALDSVLDLGSISGDATREGSQGVSSERDATPVAFVLAELQLEQSMNDDAFMRLGTELEQQAGVQNVTWLVETGLTRANAFLSFDSRTHAQDFVDGYFANYSRRFGVGQSSKIFDATETADASRDMNSVFYGAQLPKEPEAFVYTEVQVNLAFSNVPWPVRDPLIRANPGFLAKTWLSGANTHTVGGLYAFDTLTNAKHFAQVYFPEVVAKQHAAFSAFVFQAAPATAASRALGSPFFPRQH
jgi:hypothetical protein